jgi:uncharacterized protein
MPRHLAPQTSLENLKREAKRWLHALRAGDPEARARLERSVPDAPADPALRHVQHAIAREFDLPGWSILKERLTTRGPADGGGAVDAALVDRFLENACPDHHVRGAPAHVRASATAMRLLERYPAIAHASLATAIVCGDLETVRREVSARPELASAKVAEPSALRAGPGGQGDLDRDFGTKGWEPLLYLCFTRLPLAASNDNAVAMAELLLDHGADPTVYFQAGGSRYTPYVGAVGEGEENRPPHPRRDALVGLLLQRGADPYDNQVAYNINFHGKVLWFLEAAYARSVELGRTSDWDDPDWNMLGMGGYGSGARWYLNLAIENDDVALATWCLAHGANPNAGPGRGKRFPQRSLYEEAVLRGRTEIASLLLDHGAQRTDVDLSGIEGFVAACMRLDRDDVRRRLIEHPEYLQASEPLLIAAAADRVDVVEMLLDFGMSTDVRDAQNQRPLHAAAYANALRVARALIDRGAEIDPVHTAWENTPLGAAVYGQHLEMMALLARYSRDIWELTWGGLVDRLRELLHEEPALARVAGGGHTPLMWLPPADERRAMEVAELFLANGADPTLRNNDGQTAADRAERLGMFGVADRLRAAERAWTGRTA